MKNPFSHAQRHLCYEASLHWSSQVQFKWQMLKSLGMIWRLQSHHGWYMYKQDTDRHISLSRDTDCPLMCIHVSPCEFYLLIKHLWPGYQALFLIFWTGQDIRLNKLPCSCIPQYLHNCVQYKPTWRSKAKYFCIYHSVPKKGPWAKHLTGLPKRGGGRSFNCFHI